MTEDPKILAAVRWGLETGQEADVPETPGSRELDRYWIRLREDVLQMRAAKDGRP